MNSLGGVLNHYPRNIGDYVKDTLGLTMEQDGAYSRLLDQYYASEKALPTSRGELYGIARCRNAAERKAVDFVLTKFFTQTTDGWRQKRCDVELEEMVAKSKSASRSAKLRWSERNANGDATAMRTHSESDAKAMLDKNQEPETKNQVPETKNQKVKIKGAAPPLPDWLPPKAWADFVESRKAKKKPLTPRAAELAIQRLADLRAQGYDPQEMIDRAVLGSWDSFYPPKESTRAGLSEAGSRTARNLENWAANEEAKDREVG